MHTKLAKLNRKKNIALVAHDNMKMTLCKWAAKHREVLQNHQLLATGTTGLKLEQHLNIAIDKLISGPLGGDQQIGAKISTGTIDVLIFFWDPFEPMPHDPDVKALLRIANVWNIPVANNEATADYLISSHLMDQDYERQIPDYQRYLAERS
ncbi:methylglyoxal synthase [Agarilytica rhodophyticola]|uniref:methylglyoxal synthase n=1 Tax=Agarilytica rhodophyticola TaxID=1737490 RepID=UPI000B34817D|nr:methylglyoxal synthase [Agarilytica rhodophyticola]